MILPLIDCNACLCQYFPVLHLSICELPVLHVHACVTLEALHVQPRRTGALIHICIKRLINTVIQELQKSRNNTSNSLILILRSHKMKAACLQIILILSMLHVSYFLSPYLHSYKFSDTQKARNLLRQYQGTGPLDSNCMCCDTLASKSNTC